MTGKQWRRDGRRQPKRQDEASSAQGLRYDRPVEGRQQVGAGRGGPGESRRAEWRRPELERAVGATPTGRRRVYLRLGRITFRLLLALACLAIIACPFVVAFYLHYLAQWVGPQRYTSPARLSANELNKFRRTPQITSADPIVLAYHDIARDSKSQYVITPAAFEAQMAMLQAAGYHSLTATQFVHYVHGGTVPNRSVVITFDDGTRGLWTYADKILQRHHFHGISFLITGRIGTHQPYYLTWQEIQRMHTSGRWDFESHTNNLHERVPVSAAGHLGDPLTQQIWLKSLHRRESISEFRVRVGKDLRDSVSDIVEHGLPQPELFAYPFSESVGPPPHTSSHYSNQLIHDMFAAAMTNYVQPPVPVSRREASRGFISRLEIMRTDTARTLFERLSRTASLSIADESKLNDRTRWENRSGKEAKIAIKGGGLVFEDKNATWAYAAYNPGATADWDGYAISVKVMGLDPATNPSATVSVRVGSASQLNVSISNHYMEVRLGDVSAVTTILRKGLPAATAHSIILRVYPDVTVVYVDGIRVIQRPDKIGPTSTGGFALSSFRTNRVQPFASFGDLALRRLAS
jgi:poly-beta-1,6-N-acetyl-D-glucosamine N-deacetylase